MTCSVKLLKNAATAAYHLVFIPTADATHVFAESFGLTFHHFGDCRKLVIPEDICSALTAESHSVGVKPAQIRDEETY